MAKKVTPRDPITSDVGLSNSSSNNTRIQVAKRDTKNNIVSLSSSDLGALQSAIDSTSSKYYALKKQHEILTYWLSKATLTNFSPTGGGLYAGENYVSPINTTSSFNRLDLPLYLGGVQGISYVSTDNSFEDITAVKFLHPYFNTTTPLLHHYEIAKPDLIQAINAIVPLVDAARTNWNAAKHNFTVSISAGKVPKGAITTPSGSPTTGGTGDPSISDAPPTKAQLLAKAEFDKKPVITNVGMLLQNYLPTRSGVAGMGENNTPSYVKNALELWKNSVPNKGMIVTWYPPDAVTSTIVPDATAQAQNISKIKYGFQFLYNPGTISMSYSGLSQVDLSWVASGNDQFNYTPPQNGGGAISFTLLLNRQSDMAQNDTSGKLLSPGKYAIRDPYSGTNNPAGFDEQKAIYTKGTMYDFEFLLRAATGYTMRSELRNELTSDIGFYARRQVELHLGPKLRYRGFIANMSINHMIFDERMVPTLSTVEVTLSRLPDFANVNSYNQANITTGGK